MKKNEFIKSMDKQKDTIPFRTNFIQELLKNKILTPLIDFDDDKDTEYFKNGKSLENETVFNDTRSNDTRYTLHKRVRDFNKVITQIGGTLYYIKSGTTGHTFKSEIKNADGEIYNYGVKVVAYPRKTKYGEIYDSARPENAEIMMLRLLSYFVVKKQTPHIVLPIATFNTNIKPFLSLQKEEVVTSSDKKYIDFLARYKEGEFYDEVSILLSEWANSGDLLDYLRKNYKNMTLLDWKVIFFQIISTLAVIQRKFPSFRHNDLKANNILLHTISRTNPKFTYTVLKKKYVIPNIGLFVKLWDYDFACIPGIVDNIKVAMEWTKPINVTPTKHQYYDIHYFFNTLAFAGFFPQMMSSSHVPIEVKKFMKHIIPKEIRSKECPHEKDEKCEICHKNIHHKGRLLIADDEQFRHLFPSELLGHEFFSEFAQ